MKKIIFSLTILGVILIISDKAMAQSCRPNANQVAVFSDKNYRGVCEVLNIGNYPTPKEMRIFPIYSILIGTGVRAVICNDAEFRGKCYNTATNFSNFDVLGTVISIKVIKKAGAGNPLPAVVILDIKTETILGGFRNGKLLDAKTVSESYEYGENYKVFGLDFDNKQSVLQPKELKYDERCDLYYFRLDAENKSGIALSPNVSWNPAPRIPEILPLNIKSYQDVVRELLLSKGISNPTVNIKQLIRVDIEGDGKDEILISAANSNGNYGYIAKGDYSFLILRKIIDGRGRNILINGDFHRTAQKTMMWQNPTFEVTSILDLDNDGILEFVVYNTVYEGYGSTVYKIKNERLIKLFEKGCGA